MRRLTSLAAPLVLLLASCATLRAPADAPTCPGSESRLATTPPARAWHRGAVVYGVIPPLFGGEPLADVRARLPELQSLGVDALWISPLYESDDPGAINYAVTDYFRIRPDFGTDADLRALVADAHAHGMKVLLDFVPNHTSEAHPAYQDTVRRGRASPYWDWYERDDAGAATFYFDWKNLKNLNHANPAVQRMIVDSCLHWMRDFGVDGFRFDALWAVKERHPDFVKSLAATLRAEKPDVVLIAEAGARDPFYVANGFDAAYDWGDEIGHWAWEKAFDALPSAAPLAQTVAASPSPDRVLRFLNNNDTGERFVSRHGPGATRVATVLLHTLPGIAVMYAGDEVGAEYQPYDDPPVITWNDPHALAPLHRRLAFLRSAVPALRDGRLIPLDVGDRPAVQAFVRDAGDSGKAVIVANFGSSTRVRVPVADARRFRWDALAGRAVDTQATRDALELDVPAHAALVLTPPPDRCDIPSTR